MWQWHHVALFLFLVSVFLFLVQHQCQCWVSWVRRHPKAAAETGTVQHPDSHHWWEYNTGDRQTNKQTHVNKQKLDCVCMLQTINNIIIMFYCLVHHFLSNSPAPMSRQQWHSHVRPHTMYHSQPVADCHFAHHHHHYLSSLCQWSSCLSVCVCVYTYMGVGVMASSVKIIPRAPPLGGNLGQVCLLP